MHAYTLKFSMKHFIFPLLVFATTWVQAQQLSPQTLNSAGSSKIAGGIILEDALGGFATASTNTSVFMYTQDFLQPDAGSTTVIPVLNNVVLSGGSTTDNAGTTLINGNLMLEFTLGETASITLQQGSNMLTQGILQPYSTGAILPVTGLELYAKRINPTTVELNWKTQTEINNKGFFIERKKDNENSFTGIHFTATAALGGNSSFPLQYTYNDNNNYTGKTWYRIKQDDNDGRSTYSAIRIVDGSNGKQALLQVWPVPSSGPVNVLVSGIAGADKLFVVDAGGRVVQQLTVQNNSSIQLNKLLPGTYIIRLAENKELVQKIIIQ